MARTKQTARKSDSKGQIPSQSSSGHTLATFPNRRSPRFLDSDSDLERAANMFSVNPGNRQKSPARGSPARGSKRPATPSSSDSGASPCKSPQLSLPARGIPACGRGVGRGVGRSKPVGTVNPQPQKKPGQAGFVQQGGSGARGASRSSPRLTLPSFSTEKDDDDDEEEDNGDGDEEEEEDTEEEKEVDFPNQGTGQHQLHSLFKSICRSGANPEKVFRIP